MCGILGALHFDNRSVDAEKLRKASQWMKHRGPDDEGVWAEGQIGFAHRRLSIIDLSKAGHQPMLSYDQEAVITYNGECYNFKELRKDLETKGYVFRSQTDTEVVLHGFQEYGFEFVNRMNGMFAFGVWFRKEKTLYLLRDRLGVKPLYYYQDEKSFLFSSEIKPLLSLGIHPELNEKMVSAFFSLRYCPGEETLFKGIKKLKPGHYLKVTADGQTSENAYWSLLNLDQLLPLSEKQASEKFFTLLSDAVSLRQIADVPVGAFLSGGIDSSAIVALMKKTSSEVETFTFGMGSDIDESEKAKQIAGYIGVTNTHVALGNNDYEYYMKALWHLEEPIGDSIIAPTYRLAQKAANSVKVVELGEGADEILGGYVHQLAMTYGDAYGRHIPLFLLQSAKRLPQFFWEKIFPYPAKLGASGVKKISDYFEKIDHPGQAYLNLVGVFDQNQQQSLFCKDFYNKYAENIFSDYFARTKNDVFQNRLLQLDLNFWNSDYTMLRMDKLTMAHSLEARVPYLDYRLVELCLQLPRKFKTKWLKQKILLRKALANKGLLPADVISAPKKAFYLPVEKCFDHQFQQFVRDQLSEETIKKRGIFNFKVVEDLLDSNDRELVGNKQIMLLLVFELWAKLFLDGEWKKGI